MRIGKEGIIDKSEAVGERCLGAFGEIIAIYSSSYPSSYPPCLRPRSFLLSNLGEEAVGPLADLVFSQPKSRGKNVCSSEFRVE